MSLGLKIKMNRKLKIAIFEPSRMFPPGGKNMDGISKYLSKKHDVTVFTQRLIEGGADFNTSKIKFIKPRNRFLAPFAFLKRNINEQDFDLIILGCFPATLTALRNIYKKPSIYISHAPPRFFYDLKEHNLKNSSFKGKVVIHLKNFLFKKLDYLSVQKVTKILGVSKEVQRRIKIYYNRDSIIYPAGVNPEKYKKGRYDNYILSVCRLVSAKRPEMILESMKFVKNKNIKLIMVGSGDLEKKIREIAKDFSNVEIKGFVSDEELKELYANCLATIYIPINEDLGYAPQEAGVAGKATIGVNEGGLRETVIDGKTGFLINNPTPEKIAEKIDFFAENKSIAEKMGRNAEEHIKKFHIENNFKILDEIIEEII
jgi:glycosyltransferase involved in cell wall biosynthesis